MVQIKESNQLLELEDNDFYGELPELINSKISFKGKNNILVCEENVVLRDSRIIFNSNNAMVYLSSNENDYLLDLVLNNDNTFFIGRNSYFNNILTITLSERKNVIIGQDCLFSKEIQFRVADSHLIYSSKSLKRINPTKSIYIGDHVWLGQNSLILKGCHIGSGSIIGAGTILSNKKIPSNCIFAGNPAKLVKKDIFWDPSVVHEWSVEKTKSMERYTSKNNIFDFDENETTDFNDIENKLDSLETSEEKLDYIKNNLTSVTKNRFFIGKKIKMTRKIQINVLILFNKVFNKLKMN